MLLPQNVRNLIEQQIAYAPNARNFNDYVKYSRGSIRTGQTPSASGFRQYMGEQPQSPGGAKNQLLPQAPVQSGGNAQLTQIPQQQLTPQPVMPGGPSKGGAGTIRPQQYGAALSRMK